MTQLWCRTGTRIIELFRSFSANRTSVSWSRNRAHLNELLTVGGVDTVDR